MDSYSIGATSLILQNSFPGLSWTAIPHNFVRNITPGRYLLRKDNCADPTSYVILTSIVDKSNGQVKLYVTDKKQHTGEPGDIGQERRKKIIKELQCDCLMYNIQVDTLAEVIRGKLQGDVQHHENLLFLKLESINQAVLEEFTSCALVSGYDYYFKFN